LRECFGMGSDTIGGSAVSIGPYFVTALILFWLCFLIYEPVRRMKIGLPPIPPPSPFLRWVRIIWGVIFFAYMIWVLAGWTARWFAPR
jgi:hypothetical protein